MSLTTVGLGVGDDWIGTKNAELDGLMIREDKLTIRRCEFLSGSIKQSTKGDVSLFFSLRLSPLYSSFWTILVLHLLVIYAYTWVHVPSATPSNVRWVVVTQIALFRSHVHINGAKILVMGI